MSSLKHDIARTKPKTWLTLIMLNYRDSLHGALPAVFGVLLLYASNAYPQCCKEPEKIGITFGAVGEVSAVLPNGVPDEITMKFKIGDQSLTVSVGEHNEEQSVWVHDITPALELKVEPNVVLEASFTATGIPGPEGAVYFPVRIDCQSCLWGVAIYEPDTGEELARYQFDNRVPVLHGDFEITQASQVVQCTVETFVDGVVDAAQPHGRIDFNPISTPIVNLPTTTRYLIKFLTGEEDEEPPKLSDGPPPSCGGG